MMGTRLHFGGISLVTVEDLFQLRPVFDKWIFETSSNVWHEHFKMHELTTMAMFDNSTQDNIVVDAHNMIIGDVPDKLKDKIKQKIPDDSTKTMDLYSTVSITTSGKYHLTTNVSVSDGMTNSTECIVKKIDYKEQNCDRPSVTWVLFDKTNVGYTYCKENSHLYDVSIAESWTPILEITRQFRISNRSDINVLRRQFPLWPAAAKLSIDVKVIH